MLPMAAHCSPISILYHRDFCQSASGLPEEQTVLRYVLETSFYPEDEIRILLARLLLGYAMPQVA